jgi:hypothetical protein
MVLAQQEIVPMLLEQSTKIPYLPITLPGLPTQDIGLTVYSKRFLIARAPITHGEFWLQSIEFTNLKTLVVDRWSMVGFNAASLQPINPSTLQPINPSTHQPIN